MPQSTIGLRFNIDTGNAPAQVGNLTRTVAELNEELTRATEEKDWAKINQLSQAIENATSARGRIMQQANQAQSQQARENMRNGGIFGGNGSDIGKYLLTQTITQLTDGIIKALEKGFQAVKQRAGGDLTGAAVTEKQATGDAVGTGVGFATTIIGSLLFGPMAGAFAGSIAEKITTYIANGGTRELEKDLIYSAQYKKVFPEIDALNQLYGGDINKKSLEDNNIHGLQMYGRASEAADWTGLTTSQFVEAMKQTGGYGAMSEDKALNMTQNQALWSRFTGTDLSTIQKYAGQSYRFGGNEGAVSTAYGGLMAQNMGKGQFSEFLNSMERILEEGIAKGFVRSSEEIAGNMQMLYKLSGESSLWQGEQGANRLSQMNTAISNSTNLQSVEDVINFGVARELLTDEPTSRKLLEGENGKRGGVYTGTYVDAMQILEQGISPELLKGQFEAVSKLEGNNRAGIIERFKSMFGLNYTGAAQVWEMMDKARDPEGNYNFDAKEYAKQIKEMSETPGFASDSALFQKTMNEVAKNLANIGQIKFAQQEMKVLQEQAKDVASILAELRGGRVDPLPGISEEVLREHANRSLPVSHSMIFNDAAIKPGTTGLEAYNQIKERYFKIIQDHDERRFLSEAPAMSQLLEFMPRAMADGEFSTTGRNNDFDHANRLLDILERNIADLTTKFQGLTEQMGELQRNGIPINGDITVYP